MKNKVIRLALVSILVVAMVLSMAACGPKEVTPTPTPTPTTATPTPVVTPAVTPVPTTPAPVTGSDNEKALAKYGIKLESVTGTFSADKVTAKFDVDVAGLAKKGTVVTVGNSTTALSKDSIDAILAKADYEGSHPNLASATAPVATKTDDGFKITFTGAGTYTIEIPVVFTTKNAAFGGQFDKETVVDEYVLTAKVVVNKKDVALSAKDKAVVVASSPESVTFGKPNLTNDDVLKNMVGYNVDTRKLDVTSGIKGYLDGTVAGEYEVVNAFQINGKDVSEAPEFKDYNVTLGNSKFYILTKEQFTNVKDVTTSLTADAAVTQTGADDIAWANDKTLIDALYGADSSKAPFARLRYDSLSTAEKAWFNYDYTGAFAGISGTTKVNEGKLVAALEAAEKTAAKNKIVENFVKVIKDSKLPIDSDFNIANVEHVAAYNAVLAAHNALSKTDKDLIGNEYNAGTPDDKTDDGDANNKGEIISNPISNADYIARFVAATVKMNGIPVKAVQELIDGAIGAYHKALVNLGVVDASLADASAEVGGKFYYISAADGAKYFISNSEVVSITNQAKAAYDKLTADQKELLGNPVITTTTTFNVVATQDKKDLAEKILAALVSMNERVTYMAQVVNYVNIQDYSTKGVVFDSLNAVVYADEFFKTAGNGAMKDIAATKTANYEEIITEYKAWIDAILAVENYKNAKIDAFKAQLAATITTGNYKENSAFYNALNKDIYAPIIAAIEGELAITTIAKPTANAVSGAFLGEKVNLTTTAAGIYTKWFNATTGKANAETVKELYADLEVASWDAESLVDKYIKALAGEATTKLADAE